MNCYANNAKQLCYKFIFLLLVSATINAFEPPRIITNPSITQIREYKMPLSPEDFLISSLYLSDADMSLADFMRRS